MNAERPHLAIALCCLCMAAPAQGAAPSQPSAKARINAPAATGHLLATKPAAHHSVAVGLGGPARTRGHSTAAIGGTVLWRKLWSMPP